MSSNPVNQGHARRLAKALKVAYNVARRELESVEPRLRHQHVLAHEAIAELAARAAAREPYSPTAEELEVQARLEAARTATPSTGEIMRGAANDWATSVSDLAAADRLRLDVPAGLEGAEVDSCTVDLASVDWNAQPGNDHDYLTLYELTFEAAIALRGWADATALQALMDEYGALQVDQTPVGSLVLLQPRTASVILHVRVDDGVDYPTDRGFLSAEWAPKWGA